MFPERFESACPTHPARLGPGPATGKTWLTLPIRMLLGLSLTLLLSGCGTGLFSRRAEPPVIEPAGKRVADDYLIGSGDQLSIFVYHNPDLRA